MPEAASAGYLVSHANRTRARKANQAQLNLAHVRWPEALSLVSHVEGHHRLHGHRARWVHESRLSKPAAGLDCGAASYFEHDPRIGGSKQLFPAARSAFCKIFPTLSAFCGSFRNQLSAGPCAGSAADDRAGDPVERKE